MGRVSPGQGREISGRQEPPMSGAFLTKQMPLFSALRSSRPPLSVTCSAPEPCSTRGAVVVNVYNKTEFIGACLRSLGECLPADVSVVLVDNGSTEDLAARIAAEHPWIHCLRVTPNRGYASGANAGIRYALEGGAQAVYLLNDDTVVCPRFWEECERWLGEGRAVVSSIPLYHDRPGTMQFAGCEVDPETLKMQFRGKDVAYTESFWGYHECGAVIGVGWMISREALVRLGGLREAFGVFFEDTEFCLRARRAGYRVGVAGGSRILHKGSETIGLYAPRYHYHMYRNLLWFGKMQLDPRTARRRLPAMVLGDVRRVWREHRRVRRSPRLWWAIARGLAEGFLRPRPIELRGELGPRL
jgi:GT2 family glycosyltransferase